MASRAEVKWKPELLFCSCCFCSASIPMLALRFQEAAVRTITRNPAPLLPHTPLSQSMTENEKREKISVPCEGKSRPCIFYCAVCECVKATKPSAPGKSSCFYFFP